MRMLPVEYAKQVKLLAAMVGECQVGETICRAYVENVEQGKLLAQAMDGECRAGETICRGYKWKMLSS